MGRKGAVGEISIHEEIGAWGIRARDFIRDLQGLGEVDEIRLSIHSPGGDVFDGIAIHNVLRNHAARKIVSIEGLAASMASVIAMAGDEIHMPENAFMMIHNPWSLAIGDAETMRKEADLLDKVRSTLVAAYARRCPGGEAQIEAWMDAETWFTGAEALEAGLCDMVTAAQRMAASDRLPEWMERFGRPAPKNDIDGGKMSEKRKWFEIMAGSSKAEIEERDAKIVSMGKEIADKDEMIRDQAAAIEKLAGEKTKMKSDHEAAMAELKASVDAKAAAKALELAAAQGVPEKMLPAPGTDLEQEPTTADEIRAAWRAMADGPEKRKFFQQHRAILLS